MVLGVFGSLIAGVLILFFAQKIKENRYKIIIRVFGFLFLALPVLFGIWSNYFSGNFKKISSSEQIKNSGPESSIPSMPETSGWQTYLNDDLGVDFKYPDSFGGNIWNPSFWPPRITVISEDPVEKGCPEFPVGIQGATQEKIIVRDVNFTLYKASEGAVGSSYTNYCYVTEKDQRYYVVNFVIRTTNGCGFNCGSYCGTGYEQECKDFNYEKEVVEPISQIISTFKFKEANGNPTSSQDKIDSNPKLVIPAPTQNSMPTQTPTPTPTPYPLTVLSADVFEMEDDGSMIDENGAINRSSITKKFYQNQDDLYDFLVIYNNDTELTDNFTAVVTKNDVRGIGLNIFDDTNIYGSAGKLKTIVDMRSINFFDEKKDAPIYRLIAHEIGHAWSMYVRNPLSSGARIDYESHFWDGLQTHDRYDGLMQDNNIIDNGNGTYSIIHYNEDHMSKFHPFALYLMGLESPENIRDKFLLIRDLSMYTSGPYYENGLWVGSQQTYTSSIEYVTIDDFITAIGEPRNPSSASQENFTVGYILVTRKGTQSTLAQQEKLIYIANTFPQKWAEATFNKSKIIQP